MAEQLRPHPQRNPTQRSHYNCDDDGQRNQLADSYFSISGRFVRRRGHAQSPFKLASHSAPAQRWLIYHCQGICVADGKSSNPLLNLRINSRPIGRQAEILRGDRGITAVKIRFEREMKRRVLLVR